MNGLREIGRRVGALFAQRALRQFYASLFVKLVLIAGGSAIASIAQFMALPETPSAWQVAGIAAALIAGLGAMFVVVTDADASSELSAAREAVEAAREEEEHFFDLLSRFDEYESEVQRAVELYAAMMTMRGVIEQVLASPLRDPIKIIETVMTAAKRSLPIAMGFQQADRWTICVFFADTNERQQKYLRCVAHARAIECQISEARTWPEGVGVGGVAYSNGREVIVPDLTDEAMGTVFDLGDRKRGYDDERYKSLAAVPVLVDRGEKPWGVVIATNDRAHHFNTDDPGVRTVEAVRALAGMVALAVSVSRSVPRAAGKPP